MQIRIVWVCKWCVQKCNCAYVYVCKYECVCMRKKKRSEIMSIKILIEVAASIWATNH